MEATARREQPQINVLDQLAHEYAKNKAEADRLTQRNREIAGQFLNAATFKPGSATGRLEAGGLEFEITKTINEKWDQSQLNAVRSTITDAAFLPLFRFEWKPKGRELKTFLALPGSNEIKAAILSARTLTPGAPSVKIKEPKS